MNRDRFDQWQDMMDAWAALEADRQALAADPLMQSPVTGIEDIETQMGHLRLRIGAFIQQAGRSRGSISGDIRMGLLSARD